MTETSVKKHSKLAVASTILPLAIWLCLWLLALLINWRPFGRFVDWIFRNDKDSLGALGVILIVGILLFGAIPITGHLAGIVCGIMGLFSKDKKRIYAVIGLILNILPFVAGIVIYVIYKSGYDFGI